MLVADGPQVTVVDLPRNSFTRLGPDLPGAMAKGTELDEDVLRKAGIEQAEGVAALTNGDNRNIMAAQIAREIFHVPRVITRIYDPIRENVYRELGLDTTSPTLTGVREIHRMLKG